MFPVCCSINQTFLELNVAQLIAIIFDSDFQIFYIFSIYSDHVLDTTKILAVNFKIINKNFNCISFMNIFFTDGHYFQ